MAEIAVSQSAAGRRGPAATRRPAHTARAAVLCLRTRIGAAGRRTCGRCSRRSHAARLAFAHRRSTGSHRGDHGRDHGRDQLSRRDRPIRPCLSEQSRARPARARARNRRPSAKPSLPLRDCGSGRLAGRLAWCKYQYAAGRRSCGRGARRSIAQEPAGPGGGRLVPAGGNQPPRCPAVTDRPLAARPAAAAGRCRRSAGGRSAGKGGPGGGKGVTSKGAGRESASPL